VEERTRLALATEAAAIGIWEWNTSTNKFIWDDRMYEIYGVPRGSAITYDIWRSYVHPDDLREQETQLERIGAENDERGQLDFRIRRAHETVRYLHTARAVKWSTGSNDLKVVGTAIDITERKQTELVLQQHAMQQGLIAQFGQQALASTDVDALWEEAALVTCRGLNIDFCKVLQLSSDKRAFILKTGAGWEPQWR
jgi:PAS domain S-box-containing protein